MALARAIVFEPPVLLMDEPLSALDKYLRSHLQGEIKRIQRELGITVIYVTHDQDEAMTMSDRICVMNEGRICQIDAPETLYRKPNDVFVAGFLGESNMLTAQDARFEGGSLSVSLAGDTVALPVKRAPASEIVVSVRPEHLSVSAAADGTARIADVTYVGDHRRYEVLLADGRKLAVKSQIVDDSAPIGPGEKVKVAWPAHQMRVFCDGATLQ
nr:ABC transporter ATP-binding protein [Pseudaminobacter salicylatoxidans]